MSLGRRELLALLAAPKAFAAADCSDAPGNAYLAPCMPPPRGIEGQRKADMGDGRYLNPVLAGDRPDPTVLKDGSDYYLTYSSFEALPGLLIWHSRDLVNWQPLANALHELVGSVWAPDLCKHMGRYYLYLPVKAQPNDIRAVPKPAGIARRMQLKLRCVRHVLTLFSRADAGQPWDKFPVQMDVSGYHHNTAGGFASLRPAVYAAGRGEARFANLRYRALD